MPQPEKKLDQNSNNDGQPIEIQSGWSKLSVEAKRTIIILGAALIIIALGVALNATYSAGIKSTLNQTSTQNSRLEPTQSPEIEKIAPTEAEESNPDSNPASTANPNKPTQPANTPPPVPAAEPAPQASKYQTIYDTYAHKLRTQCPTLSMMECAEISNDGILKMAEYMYSARGTDGQYATYESWAGKLQDVYMAEAR